MQQDATVFDLIRSNYDKMTNTRREIADYVLNNASEVVQLSISTLAARAGVKSEASIVRFYNMIGFDSYKNFKIKLAQDLVGKTFFHSTEDLNIDDTLHEIRQKFISSSISCLTTAADQPGDDVYEAAMDLICNANRIILLGYAASAAICYYAHFRFLELGINSHFSPDPHINAAILTQPNPSDLILCVSVSGETMDIVRQLTTLPPHSASVLSLTTKPDSTIARMSDVVICTPTHESSIITDAMNARLLQMCAVDVLYSTISIRTASKAFSRLSKIRTTFQDYKTHP